MFPLSFDVYQHRHNVCRYVSPPVCVPAPSATSNALVAVVWRKCRMDATYCCGGMHRDSGGTLNGERWPTSRCYSVTATADCAAIFCSAEMTCSPPTPTHRAHTVRPTSHADLPLFLPVPPMPCRCMCRRKVTFWFPGLVASPPFQIRLEVPHLLYSMISV